MTDTTEGEDRPFAIVVCIAVDDEVEVIVLTVGLWVPLVCVPLVNGCSEAAVKGIRRETVSDVEITEDWDVGGDADDEVAEDDTVVEGWVSACVIPTTVDFGSNSSSAVLVAACSDVQIPLDSNLMSSIAKYMPLLYFTEMII